MTIRPQEGPAPYVINPLGEEFNPFDPKVQKKLNRSLEDIAKLMEIYDDLQRVVVQTWPKGGGGAVEFPFFMGLVGPAQLVTNRVNTYDYRWETARLVTVGGNAGKVYSPDINKPNSETPGYGVARNIDEVLNSANDAADGVLLTGHNIPGAVLTMEPVPIYTTRWFWHETYMTGDPPEPVIATFFSCVNAVNVTC